jgi:hypothetical protein
MIFRLAALAVAAAMTGPAFAHGPELGHLPKPAPTTTDPRSSALRAQAAAVFGVQPGQTFHATAVVRQAAAPKTESLSITIPAGKGIEVKAEMAAGADMVFHWIASGDVAVDMHGDQPSVKDQYTSYWIEGAQREASGTLTAPFAGLHGWYWLNKGRVPVTVKVTVTGFQEKLLQPAH